LGLWLVVRPVLGRIEAGNFGVDGGLSECGGCGIYTICLLG
jgi:hypothetical protein